MPRTCWLYQSDRPLNYAEVWAWQKQLVNERKQAKKDGKDLPDVLLLVEHPAVYTLGQGASLEFLRFNLNDPAIECHRIERGGEVTYHAIGQVVGYPILNLDYYQRDLHWYLRQLEEVIVQTLSNFGIVGQRLTGLTGVWIEQHGQYSKIAQVGIKVSQWVTMHGFSLNVCMDLAGFERIVPCGIANCQVCNLQDFAPHVSISQVRLAIAASFAHIFNLRMVSCETMPEIMTLGIEVS